MTSALTAWPARTRGENVKRGKEKFQNKQKQRQQQAAASAKRRAEERERMQKLQFEIAKKAQLKVQIPDAIGVGELASRMKKTGAEVVTRAHKERRNGLAFGHHRLRHRRACGRWSSAARSSARSSSPSRSAS